MPISRPAVEVAAGAGGRAEQPIVEPAVCALMWSDWLFAAARRCPQLSTAVHSCSTPDARARGQCNQVVTPRPTVPQPLKRKSHLPTTLSVAVARNYIIEL